MAKRVEVDAVEPDPEAKEVKQPSASASAPSKAVAPKAPSKKEKDIKASHEHGVNSPVDDELERKSSSSALSAFMAHPPGIFFADKQPEEQLLLLLRAHIITNVPWILVTLILIIIPIILLPFIFGFGVGPGVSPDLVLSGTLFWYAATFTYAFINFLYWYFNVYIVTDERVIDVDWYSIIYRKVSSTQISKIQDVSAAQSGVIAGIFDFGDVEIQTAGEERNFEFTAVPHPQLVSKKIQELVQTEEDKNGSDNDGV